MTRLIKRIMNTNPYEAPKSAALRTSRKPASYRRAIVVALVQQTLILILATLMLDGGRFLRVYLCALVVSWSISLVVMLYWRDSPKPLGMAVVKYGFWLAIVLLLILPSLGDLPIFDALRLL